VNDGFRNNHGSSIWVSDFAGKNNRISSDQNYIYNNTIYLDKNFTPDISIKGRNTFIYNNVFMAVNGEIGQNMNISTEIGTTLSVSNNLFHGTVSQDFVNLDNKPQNGDPLFHNLEELDKSSFKILQESPVINKGMMFPEPNFTMAGKGIFKHVTPFASKDTFDNKVDFTNNNPNIGASNQHNSNLVLGLHPVNEDKSIFKIYPNPAAGEVHFLIKEGFQPEMIEIFDIQGKLVHDISPDNYVTGIDIPDSIKNGIYFLRLTSGNAAQTNQFVIYR